MNLNSLALAYLGDAIYELYVRKYLLSKNIVKVKELQKEAVNYVSAKSQANFLNKMIDDNFLTDEEIDIVLKRRKMMIPEDILKAIIEKVRKLDEEGVD